MPSVWDRASSPSVRKDRLDAYRRDRQAAYPTVRRLPTPALFAKGLSCHPATLFTKGPCSYRRAVIVPRRVPGAFLAKGVGGDLRGSAVPRRRWPSSAALFTEGLRGHKATARSPRAISTTPRRIKLGIGCPRAVGRKRTTAGPIAHSGPRAAADQTGPYQCRRRCQQSEDRAARRAETILLCICRPVVRRDFRGRRRV